MLGAIIGELELLSISFELNISDYIAVISAGKGFAVGFYRESLEQTPLYNRLVCSSKISSYYLTLLSAFVTFLIEKSFSLEEDD